MKVSPDTVPLQSSGSGAQRRPLSDAGGLRQFGAFVETLPPGAQSSNRHWHSAEDELLFVLQGCATVQDDDGAHDLLPGEAACWRHGDPNAHHVVNRGTVPLRFVIIGTRVAGDICHYPDSGQRLVNGTDGWALQDATGAPLRTGPLPPALRDAAPVWGQPHDPAQPFPRLLRAADLPWQDEPDTAHPILGTGPGPYRACLMSDRGGLTQFGAFVEELPPGSSSGRRHWHETEDEMILMLQGAAILVEDHETPLAPGDAACWPAGQPTGHRIDNRSTAPARYLVIGTRQTRDTIHYTDHDLITLKDGAARRYLHRDGSPYPST